MVLALSRCAGFLNIRGFIVSAIWNLSVYKSGILPVRQYL